MLLASTNMPQVCLLAYNPFSPSVWAQYLIIRSGIAELCGIKVTLTARDRRNFVKNEIFDFDGERVCWIHFLIRITYNHPDMYFELLIPRKGQVTSCEDWTNALCFGREKKIASLI